MNSNPNPTIMTAVEKLGYRVTRGDVAAQAGIDVTFAEQELLALASVAGGHLQVAESGEIAFQFPQNFRAVLRNKFWRLKLQEVWQKIWRILFYLIRISFGILLLASILLIFVTIAIILIAVNSSSDRNDSGGNSNSGGGFIWIPYFWISPDLFWFFSWDDRAYTQRRRRSTKTKNSLNFFESVFSFLFGDGNPNANLEERRWRTIGSVIRNHQGAVIAEQIAPYLDDLGTISAQEYEEYMLPVLTRFDGRPEVSPDGQLVYHFPQLQTTATNLRSQPISSYLEEKPWRFSQASSGQIMLAIGLGGVNIIGALMLGSLIKDAALVAKLGGLVAFTSSIYPLLLAYGIGFLTLPLIRYFWVQWRNSKVENRNRERQVRAIALEQGNKEIQKKLNYAREFAAETVIIKDDVVYTTETDLLDQEIKSIEQADAEWQKRLNQSS